MRNLHPAALSDPAEALLGVRYPAMSDDERDLCGLITITYPVVREP